MGTIRAKEFLKIDKRSPVPRHVQLQDGIKRMIVANGLKRGDRIPPERRLMTEAQVSRNTVREAVAQLMLQGILVREKVKGTFVKKVPALSLEQTRRFGIALVAASPEAEREIRTPHSLYSMILTGFSDEARAANTVTLLFTVSPSRPDEDLPVTDLDALLVVGHVTNEMMERLSGKVRHVVAVTDYPLASSFNLVRVDARHGACEATRYILNRGIHEVSLVTGDPARFPGAAELIAGCRQAFAEAGASKDIDVRIRTDEHTGYDITRELLAARTGRFGIVAAGGPVIRRVLHALAEHGPEADERVLAVGYVEGDVAAAVEQYPVTLVGASLELCGQRACRVLQDLIEGRATPPVDARVLPAVISDKSDAGRVPNA
ncbi:MAG: GntR family transcriptional regulator [Kiritimatiellae bacterium]|nr:GntR family transcriptional regulator [Kiritimatiellia bacterium]